MRARLGCVPPADVSTQEAFRIARTAFTMLSDTREADELCATLMDHLQLTRPAGQQFTRAYRDALIPWLTLVPADDSQTRGMVCDCNGLDGRPLRAAAIEFAVEQFLCSDEPWLHIDGIYHDYDRRKIAEHYAFLNARLAGGRITLSKGVRPANG